MDAPHFHPSEVPPGFLAEHQVPRGYHAPLPAVASAQPPVADAGPDAPSQLDAAGAAAAPSPLETEYFVNRILAEDVADDGTPLFRVRWTGYGADSDTWEPEEYLPPGMVSRFRNRMRRAHRH